MISSDDRPDLQDVTLVAVTSVALDPTVDALHATMRQARFAEILLLSDKPPPRGTDSRITWRPIESLGSRSEYSRFILHDLSPHIRTGHALCIQWDGFVLNGSAWDDRFLDYDYIGAVWPHFPPPHNVGNGGFSLRSKRLLEACRNLPYDNAEVEDVYIGRTCRDRLEREGLRFASEAVASRFSHERTAPTGGEFGFHGVYNLVRYLPGDEAYCRIRELEPALLARSEVAEIFWWSVRHGRLRLAAHLLARIVAKVIGTSSKSH